MAPSDHGLRLRAEVERPGLLVLAASGEVDALTAETLQLALALGLPATTVLDLSELTLLSAAGLRVLVRAAERAATEGRRLLLVADNPVARRLLTLARLETAIPVHDSIEEALQR
ncbi:STAS domain-containing protein [Amycolatopsis sp. lyj-23]|uniref:STAS domain-containing protein n=1 Tax=Amycolatopsis sp. lyj-23 TaxID=2789283 RepID=UPI00397A65C4